MRRPANPVLIALLCWVFSIHATATSNRTCLMQTYRTLANMKRYPKFSKVDGTQIYTPHEYILGIGHDPKWRDFAEKIKQARTDYAPRLNQRRIDYLKAKDESKLWIKPPSYGYERMKKDAEKMCGKTVQEAFEKFNPGAKYDLISDGAKIIISPRNKVRGKDYVEVLYDVSGNYFRLQKGRYFGGNKLSFVSDHVRYLDWSGEFINTERVKGQAFHDLMEKSHWNALIE